MNTTIRRWRRGVHLGIAIAAATSLAMGLAGCSAGSGSGGESDYPTKDITLTVQAAAGGGSDLASRAIAKVMEKELGTTIVVENRPGAGGAIAIRYVSKQKPDGYHIGFVPIEISLFEHEGVSVSPDSVEYLAQIMTQWGVISVPASSPYTSLDDLMKAAKTKKITVGNSGPGSATEVAGSLLAKEGKVSFTPVPFDGSAPAVAAAMGGKVDAAISGVGEAVKAANSKKIRILAVFADKKQKNLPDVPTAKSQGYDVTIGFWGGLYAPKGLPDNVKKTLEKAIKKATQSPDFTKVIEAGGTIPQYKDSKNFTKFVKSEFTRYGEVLKD